MTRDLQKDPLEVLRAADPASDDRLSSASLARVRARVREGIMTAHTTPRRTWVRPVQAGVLITAIGALAVAIVLGSVGSRGQEGLLPGTSAPGIGACVAQYSLDTLRDRDFAFDGVVSSIAGDRVTFSLRDSFRGITGDSVTLDAPGMTGASITSVGGPNLAVGSRYLVAGDATFVWGCGFTQPYDAGIAAEWGSALG